MHPVHRLVSGINWTKDGDPTESVTGQMPNLAYLCIQDLAQVPPTPHGGRGGTGGVLVAFNGSQEDSRNNSGLILLYGTYMAGCFKSPYSQ